MQESPVPVDSHSRLQTESLTEPRESHRDAVPQQSPVAMGGVVSRRSSDVLYVLLSAGSLRKVEFIAAEQRVVFRFGEVSHDETVAIAVGLLDLDRLVRLFQATQADAKTRGFIADAITRTVTTPGSSGAGRPARPVRRGNAGTMP